MVRFLAAVALCAAAAARADLVSDLESAPWIGDGRRAGDEGPAPEFFALFRRDVSALSGREVRFHIVCAGSYSLSVNGRKVDMPGVLLNPGDVITVRERSAELKVLKENLEVAAAVSKPAWLTLEGAKGTVVRMPERADIPNIADEQVVVEFYSK